MDKYKVVVVEDQLMPRELFKILVSEADNYELAAVYESADQAELFCLRNKVDLVLMDVLTKNGSFGLDAAEKIKQRSPETKIIIVTSIPECSWMDRARKMGVESFWYKDTSMDTILDLMNRTMNGESVYPDRIPKVRLGMALSDEFTPRELEVLREMTGGCTNREIADKLSISVSTIKTHIVNMLIKTGFNNRTQLAIKARESGIVILDSEIRQEEEY